MKFLVILFFVLPLALCRPTDEEDVAAVVNNDTDEEDVAAVVKTNTIEVQETDVVDKPKPAQQIRPFDCKPCDKECPKVDNCAFDTVKDRCGCCDVCAQALDARCDPDNHPYENGTCGKKLECIVRIDPLKVSGLQHVCHCIEQKAVCGNDTETYDTICHLVQAMGIVKNLSKAHDGPCRAAPKIKSVPLNTKRPVGQNVFLSCEARGFPIPTIEWMWKDNENNARYLPTDDRDISVNNRGGPEKYMVTGWVQIMDLKEYHQGDFTCVAQNEIGMDSKTARVNIDIRTEDENEI